MVAVPGLENCGVIWAQYLSGGAANPLGESGNTPARAVFCLPPPPLGLY